MNSQPILKALLSLLTFSTPLLGQQGFGGFAISYDLYKYITEIVPAGSTILELGSGSGTDELATLYTMFSVEHDKIWLSKYNSTYIYAPIKNYGTYRWYDVNVLDSKLPKKYSLILVDGPTGKIGRYGFFNHIHLFDTNAIMIFDDVNRPAELRLLEEVAEKVGRPYEIHECSDGKSFGVIMPEDSAP